MAGPFEPSFAELPRVIPIFPLAGAVLLPGGMLPLNIFEPRYLNMLDEEIDFVAKFENLGEDLCYVKSQLGLAIDFNIHKERSIRDSTYQKYYDDSACADVADLYGNDITHFGYEFDSM